MSEKPSAVFMDSEFKRRGNIEYTEGYKYQLERDEVIATGITGFNIETDWIRLSSTGLLYIRKGYAWDGPSGPTYDTPTFMRGSLAHDAIYQLCRFGFFSSKDREKVRKAADSLMDFINKQDGMGYFRRKYTLYFVRKLAGFAANPKNKKKIQYAPEPKHRNIIDPPIFYKG